MNRPIPVIIVAVLGLLLGCCSLCSAPFGMLPYVMDMGVPNPVVDMIKASPAAYAYMMSALGCGALLNLLMVICCIGAFLMKRWARAGLILYSVLALLMALGGLVFNATYLFPMLRSLGLDDSAIIGGMVGGLVGTCIGMCLPLAFLIVMFLPGVKSAFTEAAMAGDDEEYEI